MCDLCVVCVFPFLVTVTCGQVWTDGAHGRGSSDECRGLSGRSTILHPAALSHRQRLPVQGTSPSEQHIHKHSSLMWLSGGMNRQICRHQIFQNLSDMNTVIAERVRVSFFIMKLKQNGCINTLHSVY